MRSHDVALASSVGLDLFSGSGRGKSKGTEDIHDQVDVDKLNRVEDSFLLEDVADKNEDEDGEVASDLELEEALNVHEDVAAPHDGFHG